VDYITKTDLILPFKEIWMVSNGGRNPKMNNHIPKPPKEGPKNQLFAYDFRNGHKSDGKELEDYDVFGKKVIAPGDGIISQVINGSIDIPPGEFDRFVGVGNCVIIDHKNGEWSVLAHFKHNSIKVKPGQKIKQGDLLGLCGNTGNTSEPHVHFHLQDNAMLHRATGIPAQFRKINVNGEIRENYEPTRFEKVSNIIK